MTTASSGHFSRAATALAARIDNEVVVFQMERGTYVTLNLSAAAIWDLIETPADLDQICQALQHRFRVEPETCREEVCAALAAMQHERILEFHPTV